MKYLKKNSLNKKNYKINLNSDKNINDTNINDTNSNNSNSDNDSNNEN
jgi:hypothetical protein